ncbi:NAD-dependent succinate-semialdehyde dehydrogenase [Novosphingobium taihuense]|uniref:Succinate-semialdehyde dehydrogenase/glutarate-semialdehyde dehydrogenase n=1 Tax=Novosphingobium taihuense TaxID=260085 RepID=A0A7W7ADH3_9SPHN|nr:NAD-dependent succinate-semialdehyde dehydrogenase [Novosphingobium taihuense]MBB4615008.1 succinate-semialdehyde dehydrogenase/glutarate-semialdehyde dehydrogenase [Novosphingobium taihuense]TWH84551.1 succinate-semialdehyde dehydrogenase/glutarate-semialdehyde dehydrogenase [Novosphingobium taihuense]
MYCELALCIDGRFIPAGPGRAREPVLNPATGETLAELPHATAAELDEALASAQRAFPIWAATSPLERSNILRRAAALLRERMSEHARILTLEQGKPLAEARGELTHSAELLEWYAEEGRRIYGRVITARVPGVEHIVLHEPVGPCAAFTPWNFPSLTPARKVGGALAAGCTVILKAAEETPGTAVELMRALHDAGLPKGCAQLVFGDPAAISAHLIGAPTIRKISFTGSTAVGKHLMRLAADGVKRSTMELGGNAPVIVCADADYDLAVTTLAAGKFRNAGQVCVSPGRFFVHESLAERFAADVAARADALQLGAGVDAESQMGPLANARRVEAMERFVADAEAHGGKVLAGGARRGNAGNFFAPTVVTGLDQDALLFSEECFGPIVPIQTFSSLEDAIARANAVEAGLAGYAFTMGLASAHRIMHGVQTGMIGINNLTVSTPETPFGGIKESGFGSEGGTEGLQAYLNTKLATLG